MRLVIPHAPLSLNHAYGNGKRGRYATPELKQFHQIVAFHAKRAAKGAPLMLGPVVLHADFFFASERNDLDNALKPFLDGLKGVVWKDDRQVQRIHAERHVDRERPRIEATIAEFDSVTGGGT